MLETRGRRSFAVSVGVLLSLLACSESKPGQPARSYVLSVSDVSQSEGTAETTTALTFTVSITPPVVDGDEVTVEWSTTPGTASAEADFVAAAATLVFGPGEASRPVTVEIVADAQTEADESFGIALGSPSSNATLGVGRAVGTILDDDPYELSIEDASVSEGTGGTTQMLFSVKIVPAVLPGESVDVDWQTLADSASDLTGDFVSASGTLTFTEGQATREISVEIGADSNVEGDETFFVELVASSANAKLTRAIGAATIIDDDFYSIAIDDPSVAEGNPAPPTGWETMVTFTVSVVPAVAAGDQVTLEFSTSDGTASATAPTGWVPDYAARQGVLTIGEGETSAAIIVPVRRDVTRELDETFSVELANCSPNARILDPQGVATILDDDASYVILVDVPSQAEGTSTGGQTEFVFTLTPASPILSAESASLAWYTSDDSAEAGSDYVAASGDVTFAPGDGARTVTILVGADADIEPDERFFLDLSGTSGNVTVNPLATGTILSDDLYHVAIADAEGTESAGAAETSLSFMVTISPTVQAGHTVSVPYSTMEGSARADVDFGAASGLLQFTAGMSALQVTVGAWPDDVREPAETFHVALTDTSPIAVIDRARGTGTIVDGGARYELTVNDVSRAEGTSATATSFRFTVSLSPPLLPGEQVNVDWATVPGSATPEAGDYLAASGNLTFDAEGTSAAVVTVQVAADSAIEPDEQFFLDLSAPSANARLARSRGTGAIVSDDRYLISASDVFVQEGTGGTTQQAVTIAIAPPLAPGQTLTVDWSTADDTALAGADYTAESGSTTFGEGESSRDVLVGIAADGLIEPQETFWVMLSTTAADATLQTTGIAVNVVNDDGVVARVDPTATGPADGLTWISAYRTVQEGIDAVATAGGGEVWVAGAVYVNGAGVTPVATLAPGVHVYGGFSGYAGGTGDLELAWQERDWASHTTTLDGEDSTDHVVVGASDATLDGFTVRRGYAISDSTYWIGGGMLNVAASPLVRNCIFENNRAVEHGGAIANVGASPSIVDTVFRHNEGETFSTASSYGGGAIYDTGGSFPRIRGCTFEDNSAGRGGAIYDDDTSGSVVTSSSFVGNVARKYVGGAIATAGQASIARSVFSRNTSAYHGGAVYSEGSEAVTIADSVFDGNTATYEGGGFWCYGGARSVTITGTVFNGNTSNTGGAIGTTGCSVQVADSQFTGNTAILGGGIEISGAATPAVRNCRFVGNHASDRGGAMFVQDRLARVVGSVFAGNSAATSGGAIAFSSVATGPQVLNSVFAGNAATVDGGAVHANGSNPTFVNCAFVGGNSAGHYGGALALFASWITMSNTSVAGNRAGDRGGGVYAYGSSPTLTHTAISRNRAPLAPQVRIEGSSAPTFRRSDVEGSGGSAAWDPAMGVDGGGNIDADPGWQFVPAAKLYAAAAGTATTLVHAGDVSASIRAGDFLEIGRDGVLRAVEQVSADADADVTRVTFSPAYSTATPAGAEAWNWGFLRNLQPAPGSPLIDAGDDALLPADSLDLDEDLDLAEPLPLDLCNHVRSGDGDGDGIGVVDIGAVEFPLP